MADFGIEIQGDPHGISDLTFKSTVNNAINLLHEYDAAISGVSSGSLAWYVSQLNLNGNLRFGFRSRLKPRKRNPVPDSSAVIAHSLVSGLDALEHSAITPPYLSLGGMTRVQNLTSLIGKNGARGFRVRADETTVDLTTATRENIEKLLPIRRTAIGSVEGKLEGINLHRNFRAIVYRATTNRAVTCEMAQDMLDTVKAYLGKRVVVFGILHKNMNGDTLRVTVERLELAEDMMRRHLKPRVFNEPTFANVTPTSEYLRRIRGG